MGLWQQRIQGRVLVLEPGGGGQLREFEEIMPLLVL